MEAFMNLWGGGGVGIYIIFIHNTILYSTKNSGGF